MGKPAFAMQDLTAGQLNAIVKRLGGHDAALRLLRGELVVIEKRWAVWKTTTFHRGYNYEFAKEMVDNNFDLSKTAMDILLDEELDRKNGMDRDVGPLDLIRCSVFDLGFNDPASWEEISAVANSLHWQVLPMGAAAQLRLKVDFDKGFIVATQPIEWQGESYLFFPVPKGLCVMLAGSGKTFRPEQEFVFALPYKLAGPSA